MLYAVRETYPNLTFIALLQLQLSNVMKQAVSFIVIRTVTLIKKSCVHTTRMGMCAYYIFTYRSQYATSIRISASKLPTTWVPSTAERTFCSANAMLLITRSMKVS